MNKISKDILEQIAKHHKGQLWPANLPNIAKENPKEFHKLIELGYITESRKSPASGRPEVECYRISAEGWTYLAGWPARLWSSIKQDLRSIIVSAITAVVVSVITAFIASTF